MKKFLMALAFVGLGTVAANAQCDEFPTPATSKFKVATNNFWSNWFVQVGIDQNVQIVNSYSFASDWHAGRTYGLNIAVGKWFTPGLGIRIKANWENGLLNRDHANLPVGLAPTKEKGGYGAIYYDNLFNLSNMFCGYNEKRVWNMSIFPRAGVLRNFSENTYAPAFGAGVQSKWRTCQLLDIYLEAAYVWTCDKLIASRTSGKNGIFSIDLGLSFNLGKSTWSKAVNLEDYEALSAEACAKLADLRKQLQAEKDENARLRDLLARQPKEKPAEKVVIASSTTSVFFNINSSKLNSKKDLINLEAIATAAKNGGNKVSIIGSADSKTGSDAYNQKLSEARAQAVADELVNLGVDRNNIEVKGQGGVNDVTPYTLNRRAIIELK